MKAMILAAGLGKRLKPLTNRQPKALVPVYGKPMIEHLLEKLQSNGCRDIIINIHHQARQIESFLHQWASDTLNISISMEKELLNTGGGLKKAAWFFEDNQPFILHNVDVLSAIDLQKMVSYHRSQHAEVTLAVKSRKTNRYLLFDKENLLIGHERVKENHRELVHNHRGKVKRMSFLGIHVISPHVFQFFPERDVFSIIDFYLLLARQKKRILAYPCPDDFWLDMGRKENLKVAEQFLAEEAGSKKKV